MLRDPFAIACNRQSGMSRFFGTSERGSQSRTRKRKFKNQRRQIEGSSKAHLDARDTVFICSRGYETSAYDHLAHEVQRNAREVFSELLESLSCQARECRLSSFFSDFNSLASRCRRVAVTA